MAHEDIPYVDVTSTVSDDGKTLTLFIVNTDWDKPHRARLSLAGLAAGKKVVNARWEILETERTRASNIE